jgi:hypothetical protein
MSLDRRTGGKDKADTPASGRAREWISCVAAAIAAVPNHATVMTILQRG